MNQSLMESSSLPVPSVTINSQFSVVSLFSGCGGSSLGYNMAGGKVLLVVEWDKNAVGTYRLNFPETPIYYGDICKLSIEECLSLAGLESGQLDVLDGSPPCQGFSIAGKRDMEDSRNQLFREYVRLLHGLRPKVFVMENVSGLIKGKMKLIFAEIMYGLKTSGYRVKARLMNTKWYGVPQSRQRIIFIGVREDLGTEPVYPEPERPTMNIRQVLQDFPAGVQGNYSPQVIAAWHRTGPGECPRKKALAIGEHVGSFNSFRLNPNRPSPTITASQKHWRWDIPRHLTVEETMILHSYPLDFQWGKNLSSAFRLIGNSVPPLFMKVIAEHIRDNILIPSRQTVAFEQVA